MDDSVSSPAEQEAVKELRELQARIEGHLANIVRLEGKPRSAAERLEGLISYYQGLLDAVPASIAVLDRSGTIVYVNKPWVDFAVANGIRRWEDIGCGANYLNVCQRASGDSADRSLDVLNGIHAVLNGECDTFELEYPCHSPEQKRWFILRVSPLRARGIDGIVVFHINITRRRLAEEKLSEEKTRSDLYIDLMSHDINNLNQVGIASLGRLLMKAGINADDRKLLTKALEALKRSSKLIDDVRKLQVTEEKPATLKPISAGEMMDEAIEQCLQSAEKQVTVHRARDGGECAVWADELLKDVFENIVGNAIKHATGPTVEITAGLSTTTSAGEPFCRIYVEDDGPGVPDSLKEQIFTRLHRGETTAHGWGLGLYLVKKQVERFRGSVWVEDRVAGNPGKGSRFVILLPLAKPAT